MLFTEDMLRIEDVSGLFPYPYAYPYPDPDPATYGYGLIPNSCDGVPGVPGVAGVAGALTGWGDGYGLNVGLLVLAMVSYMGVCGLVSNVARLSISWYSCDELRPVPVPVPASVVVVVVVVVA